MSAVDGNDRTFRVASDKVGPNLASQSAPFSRTGTPHDRTTSAGGRVKRVSELDIKGEEVVWEQIGSIASKAVHKFYIANELASVCESPIEILLGAAIKASIGHVLDSASLELVPQYKWLRFRMDFAILKNNQPVLFIECDGREFHSTPEQLANDQRKDDEAKLSDIPLLRFSGSEIHRFTEGCVERVLTYLVRGGHT